MPLEVNWNDAQSVHFNGSGIVSGAECIEANQAVINDSRLPGMRFQLVDLSAVTEYNISAVESQILADMDKLAAQTATAVKVAMVCPNDLIFGMSKIYAAYSPTKWDIKVFRDRAAATAWLTREK